MWLQPYVIVGGAAMYPLLAILLFPILWITFFVIRFLIFDILLRAVFLIQNLFVSPLALLQSLLALPFYLLLDIVLGLVLSFLSALHTCKRIFHKKATVSNAIADGITELKSKDAKP